MQAVLLEAGCEARASCRCHTGLHAIETLSEQFIRVGPHVVPRLIVDVATFAFVRALVHDVADDWVLHGDASKFTDVSRR